MTENKKQPPSFNDSVQKLSWFMCETDNGTNFRTFSAREHTINNLMLHDIMYFQLDLILNPKLN